MPRWLTLSIKRYGSRGMDQSRERSNTLPLRLVVVTIEKGHLRLRSANLFIWFRVTTTTTTTNNNNKGASCNNKHRIK